MNKTEPKIVFFDLETIPNLIEVMKIFPGLSAYPGLTFKASITTIISFGYKVFGDGEVQCKNVWDFPELWSTDVNNDLEVCKFAREILSDADAVVTHNGKRFDWKFLQTRLMHHGLDPLPKIPHIDTCSVLKGNLLLFNNRLNTAGKFLTSEEKLENGGWDLWVRVLQRDPEACKTMDLYCKQDVVLLEKVFKRLRPFISSIPNYNIFSKLEHILCPNCGGTRLQKRGMRITKTDMYQRFQCQDCGSFSSNSKKGKFPKPA